jgi:hypothetical protein
MYIPRNWKFGSALAKLRNFAPPWYDTGFGRLFEQPLATRRQPPTPRVNIPGNTSGYPTVHSLPRPTYLTPAAQTAVLSQQSPTNTHQTTRGADSNDIRSYSDTRHRAPLSSPLVHQGSVSHNQATIYHVANTCHRSWPNDAVTWPPIIRRATVCRSLQKQPPCDSQVIC